MKLMKKLAAVLLAGVLATAVLTGCGSDKIAVSTAKIADAMNQYAAVRGTGYTYTADSKLDTRATNIANAVTSTVKDDDFKGNKFENVIWNKAGAKIMETVSDVPALAFGDKNKPAVLVAMTEVPASVKDEATLNAFYASELTYSGGSGDIVNNKDGLSLSGHKEEKDWTMGTATCTVNGKKVLIVVYSFVLN